MICRNCKNTLRTDFSYCPDCGSKVIRNRLTNRSLTYDFLERYFNLDNTFLKTVSHMLIKPEKVCDAYISGVRKKYLNPVSMLAISLTLSGFVIFLTKKIAWKTIDFSTLGYLQTSSGGTGAEKIMSATLEYSSLLFLLYMPVLAFANYLIFNRKQYNFAEHTVIAIYTLTTFSIVGSIYTIPTLFISPQFYFDTALLYSTIMLLYCLYIAYKISKNNIKSLFWKIPMFLIIFLIGYFGVTVLTFVFLFFTGEISIQDFAPPK